MREIDSVVEQLDLIVGLAADHLPEKVHSAARRKALETRYRVGHLGSTLVLALLGGTGVGKSSLLNAIAGEKVASTSVLRPHTDVPLAWVPDGAEPSLSDLLDVLGISERVEQEAFPGLAILDMTDVDSIDPEHRRSTEGMLPGVDVAMWVLDPHKYADGSLHREFLQPAAAGADRMLFALNRIDTVAPEERPGLEEHLVEMLRADGLAEPVVFMVAADPPQGSPMGIDEVVEHLRDRLDEKRVHLGRVLDDAVALARSIGESLGVLSGGSIGFDEAWDGLTARCADLVARGPSGADIEEMLRACEYLVADLSARMGGRTGADLRARLTPEVVEREVVAALEAAGVPDGEGQPDRQVFVDELERRLGDPVREGLWGRASLAAAVVGITVDAAFAASRLGRE